MKLKSLAILFLRRTWEFVCLFGSKLPAPHEYFYWKWEAAFHWDFTASNNSIGALYMEIKNDSVLSSHGG